MMKNPSPLADTAPMQGQVFAKLCPRSGGQRPPPPPGSAPHPGVASAPSRPPGTGTRSSETPLTHRKASSRSATKAAAIPTRASTSSFPMAALDSVPSRPAPGARQCLPRRRSARPCPHPRHCPPRTQRHRARQRPSAPSEPRLPCERQRDQLTAPLEKYNALYKNKCVRPRLRDAECWGTACTPPRDLPWH